MQYNYALKFEAKIFPLQKICHYRLLRQYGEYIRVMFDEVTAIELSSDTEVDINTRRS